MSGFFTLSNIKQPTSQQTCVSCGLYKSVLNPRMEPFGNFRLKILNIGEGPGEVEDERGKQWQGPIGEYLQSAYRYFGVDLFEDCLNINAINCHPVDSKGDNRPPSNKEIEACRDRVLNVINQYQPKVIMLFGGKAVESIIGYRWRKDLGTISRWRGWTIPDRDFKVWICPQFHPGYPEREGLEVRKICMQDLKRALSMVDKPFPLFEDESKKVEIIEDLSVLMDLESPFTFDFETTGLKPHNTTIHEIICASVYDGKHCYAFMMPEKKSKNWLRLRNILRSELWAKIAQNMKFENTWAYNTFGCEVKNWLWDPMLASHVLDNRPWISGLKFQAYVRRGIIDYDNDIAPFLQGLDRKNANGVNRIKELIRTEDGRLRLMIYCGMDSILEYDIAMEQMGELK